MNAPVQLSAEEARRKAEAVKAVCKLDAEMWFRAFGVIKLANGKIQRGVEPDKLQMRMFEHYRQCRLANGGRGCPCLLLVYKSRRMGASTGAQAIIYHHLQRRPGFTYKLMANKDETANDVFEIMRRFAREDRFPWVEGVANVKLDHDDVLELGNGSMCRKLSAKGERPGHGDAAQVANLTEVAHYEGAAVALTAFLPSLESAFSDPDGLLVADSTPAGASGWFYKQVLEALEREKTGAQKLWDWKLIFEPWWEKRGALIGFVNEEDRRDFVESMTADEKTELERFGGHGVTLEALQWRRSTIQKQYAGNIDKFRQEYPSDPIDGFLGSGRPRFDALSVAQAITRAESIPAMVGVLELNDIHGEESVVFMPDAGGDVEIIEDPRYGCSYLIPWDTMTGEDQVDDGARQEPDWHAVQVLRAAYEEDGRIHPARVVARYGSRAAIEVAAEQARRLSLHYGECLIVPEVNNSGLAGVKYLEERGAPIIRRSRIDARTEKETLQNGWKTDPMTRKTIIDNLARMWKEGRIDIPFAKILRQMQTFVSNRSGKYEALAGEFDDEVLALAIGAYNLERATERKLSKRKRLGGAGWKGGGGFRRVAGY